ncbi:MAG TPA: hypothetical protein VFV10_10545 [Gammaproteobacteria bacterium]|nr:hypothetical protein [Gammaproteobacteria bacterium]
MNTIARLTLVASIAVSGSALAAEPVATADADARLAALQRDDSARAEVDAALLEQCAGRYEIGDGRAFIVTNEGDYLIVELPAELAVPPVRLIAASPHEFRSADGTVRVAFELDADGRVTGAVVKLTNAPAAIVASKATPHGIVLIYDVAVAAAENPSQ